MGVLLLFIWGSTRYTPIWHFNVKLAWLLVVLMEYEVYREACRIAGWFVAVSDWRIRYLLMLYYLLGLFTKEVIDHAE